jgi:hypothetical protein
VAMSPMRLGPENDCVGEDQQQLYTTDPFSLQRGSYIRTVTASVQLESNNSSGEEKTRRSV